MALLESNEQQYAVPRSPYVLYFVLGRVRETLLCDECHAYNYKYHLETRNNTPPIAYLSPSAFKGAIAPARAAAPPLMLEHEAAPSEAKERV